MKLVRVIESYKVRQVCIDHGFYTCGDCKDYTYLLDDLCSDNGHMKQVSDTDIEEIARDIIDHSDRKVFKDIVDDVIIQRSSYAETTQRIFVACLKHVMFLIANYCCCTLVDD